MEPFRLLREAFFQQVETEGDINEHLFTLCDYAKQSRVIGELGVRGGASTLALSLGLLNGGTLGKRLLSVDIDNCGLAPAFSLARSCGLDATFIQEDSIKVQLPKMDLLFIDSLHCYAHLKNELETHHQRVSRWIILHDTEVYGRTSDLVRFNHDLISMSEKTGYSIEGLYKGLSFAVDEFLAQYSEWSIERVHHHNHGLTVLRRQEALH